ncbi:VCBS repeat-containing protein [Kitasatospora sp. NPDC086791]|uniref:FG-GAP repeat domain-containing protein n=1 Tax=Kitasatospora sp. NPDC086791 TaxID=3155178 RepID=UPI003437D0D1
MVTYRPTVLRAQDELPDTRYSGDHSDHVAAAKFAGQAALRYGGALIQVNYRDYNISDSPVNLDPATVGAKGVFVSEYASHDHSGNHSDAWCSRMYYRWSRGTSWAGLNQDGRPQVFVVRSGALYTYWSQGDGSWGGPVRMADPGGRLAPGVRWRAAAAGGRWPVGSAPDRPPGPGLSCPGPPHPGPSSPVPKRPVGQVGGSALTPCRMAAPESVQARPPEQSTSWITSVVRFRTIAV